MRLLTFLAATLILAREVRAEETPGFTPVDRSGRFLICARDRSALSAKARQNLRAELAKIEAQLSKQFGTDKEIVRVRATADGEGAKGPAPIRVLVVTDEAGRAGLKADPGAMAERHDPAAPRAEIGLLLPGDELDAAAAHHLWHESVHAWYRDLIESGVPAWLTEGLAEYFAWEGVKDRRKSWEAWTAMLARIRERKEAGNATGVAVLRTLPPAELDRGRRDECWLLVQFLMINAPQVLDRVVGHLARLESDAVELSAGVSADLVRYAELLLDKVFGDRQEMQKGWDRWRDAAVAANGEPRKSSAVALTLPGTATILPDVDGGMSEPTTQWDRIARVRYESRRFNGSVEWRAPWRGRMAVTECAEDREGKRSAVVNALAEVPAMPGTKYKLDDPLLPFVSGAAYTRVIVAWDLEGGGRYRTETRVKYKQ